MPHSLSTLGCGGPIKHFTAFLLHLDTAAECL